MKTSDWFDDIPVIGKLSHIEAAAKLREIGEDQTAALQLQAGHKIQDTPKIFGLRDWLPGGPPAWQHSAHAFGYIPPASEEQEVSAIMHVGQVKADQHLKNSRLNVTLDGLYAADYPGRGEHRILFDFYGQNQVRDGAEDLHFNATHRVREGERAAILGFPIFVGLNVGNQGIAFKGFTVNVKNSDDETLLSMMDSDLFKKGLHLTTIAQPAIAPLTGLAVALTRSIATRNRNVPVQDFYLGLDFSNVTTRARLAIGSYIAVQIPETITLAWHWGEWVYQRTTGCIVAKSDPAQLIPYNYVIIGVSKYEE